MQVSLFAHFDRHLLLSPINVPSSSTTEFGDFFVFSFLAIALPQYLQITAQSPRIAQFRIVVFFANLRVPPCVIYDFQPSQLRFLSIQ